MSDIKGEYGLFIDYEYCSGCNACLTACKMEHNMPESDFGIRIFQDGPVQYSDGSWHYDYLPMPTDLCDLCADRVADGKLPTCVHHCQNAVMVYGKVEDLAARCQGRPEGQDRHLRAVSPSLNHESDGPAARVQLGLFDR